MGKFKKLLPIRPNSAHWTSDPWSRRWSSSLGPPSSPSLPLLQIITSAVVLAVSLVLGAISLMGLSQGDQEQGGYEALSRAAVMGLTDELPPPTELEDSQRLQLGASSTCSLDSGTKGSSEV